MDRTRFFNIEKVGDKQELDFLHHNLNRIKLSRRPTYYRVSEQDLMRPDMISYYAYGTVNYWWVICLVNNIQSPLEDLKVGQLLVIPHILDVYDFAKRWRIR